MELMFASFGTERTLIVSIEVEQSTTSSRLRPVDYLGRGHRDYWAKPDISCRLDYS